MIAKQIQIVGILLLALLGASAPTQAVELTVLTEEYPPITFTRDGKVTGLGSEVVEEIQRRIKDDTPIQVVPWARGYNMALKTPNVALFATMRTAERETLFKWVGPLTTVKTSFYARRGSNIHVANLEEAKRLEKIFVPYEYYSHQFLKDRGFENLATTTSPEIMARMLIDKRSPVMTSDNLTLQAILAPTGAKPQDVELIYTFMTSQNYVAFSTATPDDTVRLWQNTLDQMKRDGSFARIYKKWLPGETPPGIKPSPAWTEDQ